MSRYFSYCPDPRYPWVRVQSIPREAAPPAPPVPPLPPAHLAPVARMVGTPPIPSVYWEQTYIPETNTIYRSNNGGPYVLQVTLAGTLTQYFDSQEIGSSEYWTYKVNPLGGTESNATTVNNGYSIPGTVINDPTLSQCYSDLTFENISAVTSISLPNLREVQGTFYTSNSNMLSSLTLPKLGMVTGGFVCGASVVTLSLPSLFMLGGSFSSTPSNLETLSAPMLTQIMDYIYTNSTFLTTIDFSSLAEMQGWYLGSGNLTEVYLPSLVSAAGDFYIDCPSLVVWNAPTVIYHGNTLNFNNTSLLAASVNEILARCVASSTPNMNINLAGGCEAPTGQGLVDVVTLTGNGCTVDVNS